MPLILWHPSIRLWRWLRRVTRHRWLRRERGERGASPVEYALLVAFIVLALVVDATAFRNGANTAFNNQRTTVSTWAPAN